MYLERSKHKLPLNVCCVCLRNAVGISAIQGNTHPAPEIVTICWFHNCIFTTLFPNVMHCFGIMLNYIHDLQRSNMKQLWKKNNKDVMQIINHWIVREEPWDQRKLFNKNRIVVLHRVSFVLKTFFAFILI